MITGRRRGHAERGSGTRPGPVALDPDPGYVRGPLVVSGSTLSLAAYDHDGDTLHVSAVAIVRIDDRTSRGWADATSRPRSCRSPTAKARAGW